MCGSVAGENWQSVRNVGDALSLPREHSSIIVTLFRIAGCHEWVQFEGIILAQFEEIQEIQEEGNTIARSILRLEAPPHICPSSGFHRKITRGLKHSQENPALFHSDVLFLVLQLLPLCAEKIFANC